ncbi:MAG: ABC transporter permease [Acidimicrobiales bacterium]
MAEPAATLRESPAPTGDAVTARPARPPTPSPATGVRGRQQSALGRLRGDIDPKLRTGLSVLGLVLLIGGWQLLAGRSSSTLLPTPLETWNGGVDLYRGGELVGDITASSQRVAIGYGLSLVIGIVLGVLIGSFRSVEALTTSPIGFLRYIPASALGSLFLLWLGIDEAPKIALIVVGTVFYNILMIADVAAGVPRQLVNAAYTLGAGRWRVLRQVVLPHSVPGIIDVARINLAAAWLMLVVSELLAAESGLALRIFSLYRARNVEGMFALLIIFGIIGAVSDIALRALRRRTSSWADA